jgi:hypothetical protein
MILLGAINESGMLSKHNDNGYNGLQTLEVFASTLSAASEVPITKSGNLNDRTTFGVHLYKDKQKVGARSEGEIECPILFANCKGFYAGNALPNSEVYEKKASVGPMHCRAFAL